MLYHLTNIGPDAKWKIDKVREKFPELQLIHRDYTMTMTEADSWLYDEGCACLAGLHSIGFTRKLTDQEVFEVFQFMYGVKR